MARRRKMIPERKAFISSLLEAEMDDHLGYSQYDCKNKETDDSRNVLTHG